MDLRPDPTWRAFVKGKYAANIGYESWPEGKSTEAADFSLHELFLDYTLLDKLYLRAGKQTINWGVGYFFSPADVINVGRIDPFDAEGSRPVSWFTHPVGVTLLVPVSRIWMAWGYCHCLGSMVGKELDLLLPGRSLHLMATVSPTQVR